jgi:hypothetical protein
MTHMGAERAGAYLLGKTTGALGVGIALRLPKHTPVGMRGRSLEGTYPTARNEGLLYKVSLEE